MRRPVASWATMALLAALGAGCSFDYDQFKVGQGGAAASAGSTGAATGSGGAGAQGGSGGSGATLECPPGQKACAGACVATGSPELGCASSSCEPCAFPNATAVCLAGACAPGECAGGFGNCDGEPANGCEAELAEDPANCGACGTACVTPNAEPGCDAGECTIAACLEGFADCDGDVANGCEADVSSNPLACGGCDVTCAPIVEVCEGGACVPSPCPEGLGDCDGDEANGCETDLASSIADCGYCGHACDAPNAARACVAGACAIGTCDEPFGDCDGEAANGCEVDLATSAAHCGACGKACPPANHGTEVCEGGQCAVVCDGGFGNCDGDVANGCETDVGSDAAHCGGCGKACTIANGSAACAAGVCTIGSCSAPFEDCDGLVETGCEADTKADPEHCGACGAACPAPGPHASAVCSDGQCGIACEPGFADCDGDAANGCEIDLANDAQNCGTCGTVCTAPNGAPKCTAGACTIADCQAPYADCDGSIANGCEIDTSKDAKNCGTCGNACSVANGNAACAAGACKVAACNAPFADCDGLVGNGCETNTQTSVQHCGGCGKACSVANGNAACAAGACKVAACNAPFANCDGLVGNGCETNTQTSAQHCGGCGNPCSIANGTGTCSAGTCQVATCNAPFADCDGLVENGCETSTQTNVQHCGGCGKACSVENGTAACSGGACAIAGCNAPFANCDGSYDTGCEADTSADPGNCGACGKTCSVPNGTGACVGGTCGVGSCSGSFADCDGDAANGCEIDLSTNVLHCGACYRQCLGNNVASRSCSGGTCNSTCDPGYANCFQPVAPTGDDGCETDVTEDDENCGGCGNSCKEQGDVALSGPFECNGETRPKGLCGCSSRFQCSVGAVQAGEFDCNTAVGLCWCKGSGNCVHGEACKKVGNASVCSCNNGAACNAGQTCCQDAGCKTLTSDPAHCGACGHACPPGFVCSQSACRCDANADCNAGTAGVCNFMGVCSCGGNVCEPGERCLPNGHCG